MYPAADTRHSEFDKVEAIGDRDEAPQHSGGGNHSLFRRDNFWGKQSS